MNAQFLPIECRLGFFSNSVDLTAGMNIQTAIRPIDSTFNTGAELSHSKVNPTMGIGIRWQKDTGGFLFRFGMGAMYHVGDSRFYYSPILSLGFSLYD